MRHTTLSLATCHENRAWSTDLFYVSDEDCRLYFVSSGTTRHCQHIAANPRIAASISGQCADWGGIKGLQLDGVADVVCEPDLCGVINMYRAKFPSLQKLFQDLETDQGSQIVSRLLKSSFYRITPRWIRMIDNSKGFAYRAELAYCDNRHAASNHRGCTPQLKHHAGK